MELKRAVAELKSELSRWERIQNSKWAGTTIIVKDAIPVAETLLAALEKEKPIGAIIRCPRCDGVYDYRYPEHLCDKSGKRPGERPNWRACPTFERPSKLAGRAVDGWGWKVFRKDENGLHSEAVGRTHGRSQTLPENTWLNYWDWKEIGSSGRLCWHVLETEEDAKNWVGQGRVGRQELIVRKIAWSGLSNRNPDYIFPPQFIGHIFTAEEIYILPEEGMPAPSIQRLPKVGDRVRYYSWDIARPVVGLRGNRFTVRFNDGDEIDYSWSGSWSFASPPAEWPVPCPDCGGWLDSHAVLCPRRTGADKPAPPAERPPEKGDWVVLTRYYTFHYERYPGLHKVIRIDDDDGIWYRIQLAPETDDGFKVQGLRVVRHAADPLRVGDKVAFGSKEGWVYRSNTQGAFPRPYAINFTANRFPELVDTIGRFDPKELTLVEPVYDRPAEKDC